jgi:hypothetical protein
MEGEKRAKTRTKRRSEHAKTAILPATGVTGETARAWGY